jgi:hypothetical protein
VLGCSRLSRDDLFLSSTSAIPINAPGERASIQVHNRPNAKQPRWPENRRCSSPRGLPVRFPCCWRRARVPVARGSSWPTPTPAPSEMPILISSQVLRSRGPSRSTSRPTVSWAFSLNHLRERGDLDRSSRRLQSQWFGSGARLKQRAWNLALEMAN